MKNIYSLGGMVSIEDVPQENAHYDTVPQVEHHPFVVLLFYGAWWDWLFTGLLCLLFGC